VGHWGCTLVSACVASPDHASSPHPRRPSSLIVIEMELELMKKLCQMVFFSGEKREDLEPREVGAETIESG